jgi:hypothetical protein
MSETAPHPTTEAPASAPSIMGGGAATDARAWLPAEYQADPTFKDLADVAALAKGYKHAATLVGVDKNDVLRLPREGDIPAEVWNRLGRPEKAADYGIAGPDGIAPETVGAFAEHVHALGLNKAQAAGVMEFYAKGLAASHEARAAQQSETYEANMGTLKREWGAAFDDKLHAMKQGVEAHGGEALVQKLAAAGLANDPDVVKVFVALGEANREAMGLKGGGRDTGSAAMTPEAARAKIAELSRSAAFTADLQNRDAPGFAEAKRQWNELHEWAYANVTRAA